MLNHRSESLCNLNSIRRELLESLSKVKDTEKVLEQLKSDLISTADIMIAGILQQVYIGVNHIETIKVQVSEYMRINEDKSIDDILGPLKYLRIKDRSTEAFEKYTKKLLSLQQQTKIEMVNEIKFLSGKNDELKTESEKAKNEYFGLATRIREGTYSLVDYEKMLNESRIANIDLEKQLNDQLKECRELKDKAETERQDRKRQEDLMKKLEQDNEDKIKKENLEREARETAERNKEKLEFQQKEAASKTEQKRLIDETITLKKRLDDQKKEAEDEKRKYDEVMKNLEVLREENGKRIKDLEESLKNCNDECVTLRKVKDERDKKIEDKRIKKEKEEKRKKDEEEKIIRNQEAERLRLQEVERKRKEEEDRKIKEEQEKIRIEEEDMKKKEEEGEKKIKEEGKKGAEEKEEKKVPNQEIGKKYLSTIELHAT